MEIVLTGTTGKLGGYFLRRWDGKHGVRALGRADADLRQPEALRRVLEGMSFDVLVNCAGMTSPEACEEKPDEAMVVNGVSPGVMAEVCGQKGARMVHFSTDYVLDGSEPGLKGEGAETGPVNQYGWSKLDGEQRVLAACPSALVCRVSWIFGTQPPGFLRTVLERARRGEDLELVADKWSMPCSAKSIARGTEFLLGRSELAGVLHLANLGEPESWWSYGRKVIAMAREEGLLDREVEVRPSKLAEIPQLSVPRPIHSAMVSERLCGEPDWEAQDWEQAAREELQSGECH